jgi:hypothetical protein
MLSQRSLGIPKQIGCWFTKDWGVVGYWRGGAVKLHSGEHGLTWVSVEWKSGSWVVHGPIQTALFRAELDQKNGGTVVSFLQRRSVGGVVVPASGGVLTGVLTGLPALLEYLGSAVYPDGAPRMRSTLLVLVEDGAVKVCLSDRDQEQSLWRSGSSLEDALAALEVTLTSEHQDWRRSGNAGQQRPQAKKK